jgi:excisionase family DNA binding protein
LPFVRLSSMGVLRQAIEDQRERAEPAALGRLALSEREAADALGVVSVDFLEEHVMHELRVVRRGRRRLIPVDELKRWLEQNAVRALDGERRQGR